ncbi:MAG: AmmeMemoRadiSam system radical SAM enzyme [Clostridiales bacterium]|nr:AmmeMemoRadiSam system radical SAM enzyme [Clostridiales bacterium]
MMKEALYYKKLDHDKVQCELCPHYCVISRSESGLCKVRKNINGKLIATSYGKLVTAHLDPIEKKPLYHYYPGRDIFSIGSYGCNMSCSFCQNYELSQRVYEVETIFPEQLIGQIKGLGIAFTYNEPLINYEYILDVCQLLAKKSPDKKIVLVTNGLINEIPLKRLLPYIDAFNVDLKGQSEFYKVCGGHFKSVLSNLKLMQKKHLEVTTLLVTNHVTLEDVELLSKKLSEIDKKIPYHLSRYFPNYLMTEEATSINFMFDAYEIAERYLDYVYLGNIIKEHHTVCKKCHSILIKRKGFKSTVMIDTPDCTCGYNNNLVGVMDEK